MYCLYFIIQNTAKAITANKEITVITAPPVWGRVLSPTTVLSITLLGLLVSLLSLEGVLSVGTLESTHSFITDISSFKSPIFVLSASEIWEWLR